MFTVTQFTQGMIIVGMGLFALTLLIGVDIGLDLLLVGSILILSGFVGLWTASLTVAFVLATVLSVLYVVYGRSVIKQKLVVRTQSTNIDKLIGQTGTVKRAIPAGEYGSIKVDDEEWRATGSEDMPVGTKVTISALRGVTVEVTKK